MKSHIEFDIHKQGDAYFGRDSISQFILLMNSMVPGDVISHFCIPNQEQNEIQLEVSLVTSRLLFDFTLRRSGPSMSSMPLTQISSCSCFFIEKSTGVVATIRNTDQWYHTYKTFNLDDTTKLRNHITQINRALIINSNI